MTIRFNLQTLLKSIYVGPRDHALGKLSMSRLVDAVIAHAERSPYEHLPGYMERYWLIAPSRWTFGIGVRMHRILRSDNDRDMHTHPWWNISLILRGTYWEVMPGVLGEPDTYVGGYVNLEEPFRIKQRKPGALVFRRRTARHKLMLFRGFVVTLMITGPDRGVGWGYHVPGEGLIDRADYAGRRATP